MEDRASVCATFCHTIDESEFVRNAVHTEIHGLARAKQMKLPGSAAECPVIAAAAIVRVRHDANYRQRLPASRGPLAPFR